MQGGHGRFFVTQTALRCLEAADVSGELHGLMGLGGAAEALGQGFELPGQCDPRRVVARRLELLGVVAADEQAPVASEGAVGVGAQLKAQAAETASVVVCLVNQVAQVELGGVHGGGQLHPKLLVGVVEDELVVALAVELLGLPAGHCGGVGLIRLVRAGTVPGRGVSAGGVALGAGVVVAGLGEHFVGLFCLDVHCDERLTNLINRCLCTQS